MSVNVVTTISMINVMICNNWSYLIINWVITYFLLVWVSIYRWWVDIFVVEWILWHTVWIVYNFVYLCIYLASCNDDRIHRCIHYIICSDVFYHWWWYYKFHTLDIMFKLFYWLCNSNGWYPSLSMGGGYDKGWAMLLERHANIQLPIRGNVTIRYPVKTHAYNQ
jgi:energy-coupling factor transporter transmembrane protein EcfT